MTEVNLEKLLGKKGETKIEFSPGREAKLLIRDSIRRRNGASGNNPQLNALNIGALFAHFSHARNLFKAICYLHVVTNCNNILTNLRGGIVNPADLAMLDEAVRKEE